MQEILVSGDKKVLRYSFIFQNTLKICFNKSQLHQNNHSRMCKSKLYLQKCHPKDYGYSESMSLIVSMAMQVAITEENKTPQDY